jgi:hypothetical protein
MGLLDRGRSCGASVLANVADWGSANAGELNAEEQPPNREPHAPADEE